MKQTMISVNVYEVGDVLKLCGNDFKLIAKQRDIDGNTLAMVISAKQRMDKLYTYKVLTSMGNTIQFTPREQGREEYVGHIDLGLLMGEEVTR